MQKTILVLGAGTGGIVTAKQLSKELGGKAKIIVFEKEEKNVFQPSLLWLLVGKRKAKQIYRDTKKLSDKNIELVLGEIEKIDPENKSVISNGKEYKGDYMVISLGVEQEESHDLNNFGHNFYSLEGAQDFYNELTKFKGGKIAVLVPSLPFKCPAAPYEAAMLIDSYIKKKGLFDKSEVSLYTPEPKPMGVAGQEISDNVEKILESKGIKYYPEHEIEEVKDNSLLFKDNDSEKFDLLAFTPKHKCPSVIENTGLKGDSGWIEIDKKSMETKFQNVYAIGDITNIQLEMGKPLPKAGVFAHYQAETVAHNIVNKISGKEADKEFEGHGYCFLELGNGGAGFAGGNFYGSPKPKVKMRKPGFIWHWAKVWFEKYWLFKNF